MVEYKQEIPAIPKHLVYEELDGIPVYYSGYKEVLNKTKTLEDIMGYGGLQWFIINVLGDFLKEKLGKQFRMLSGKGGLHLGYQKNLSVDLGIYAKKDLKLKDLINKYLTIPPKIVIEIDTKADPEIFKHSNYYTPKTQRLLDFGVEQVVWLFTDSEKVTLASNNAPWITVNWSDQISVLGQQFTIEKVLNDAD